MDAGSLPYCTHIDLTTGLRVDLLTATCFRIRKSLLQPEPFPEKYQIPFAIGHTNHWPEVTYKKTMGASGYEIKTEKLTLRMNFDGTWRVDNADGREVYPSEEPQYGLFRNGCSVFDSASAFEEDNENSRHAHWFYDPETKSYENIFLDDDLIKDTFFLYGPGYPELLKQFHELVGSVPIPPLKAFGCMQTQHLACKGDQKKLMEVALTFRDKDIPCDILIIDFEWGDGCKGLQTINWGDGLEWSSSFSHPLKPSEMVAELKALHFDILLIHHSVPDFPARKNQGWTGAFFPPAIWWKAFEDRLHEGVRGIWMDTRRNDITNSVIRRGVEARQPRNRRALMITNLDTQDIICWNRESYRATKANAIGTQRFPIHWTGDCDFTWRELRWQIEAITSIRGSLCGIPYLSSDSIGRNWKILVRWRQFSALSAIARSHNTKPWKDGNPSNADWLKKFETGFAWETRPALSLEQAKASRESLAESPEDWSVDPERAIRQIQKFRYQLIPYLYSLAHENHATGMPICRPLLMIFPKDALCNAHQFPRQYMLGEGILVAPVCRDDPKMRVYLPAGCSWLDWQSREVYPGGQIVQLDVSHIERVPIFIRAGSIIPMQPPSSYIIEGTTPVELRLFVFAPDRPAKTVLVEDDGVSNAYLEGEVTRTLSSCTRDQGAFHFRIHAREGSFPSMPGSRRIKLIIADFPTRTSPLISTQPKLETRTSINLEKRQLEVKTTMDPATSLRIKVEFPPSHNGRR